MKQILVLFICIEKGNVTTSLSSSDTVVCLGTLANVGNEVICTPRSETQGLEGQKRIETDQPQH